MYSEIGDQAEGLRRMLGLGRVRTIALLGARGRAGTTSCIVNLATALAQSGRSVLVVDEHYGPANVAGMLGISARLELKHVLTGHSRLAAVLQSGPPGVLLLPAASGVRVLARLSPLQRDQAVAGLHGLDELGDLVLVDALAPLSAQGAVFGAAAQETVIVLEPDPASITKTYMQIKQLRLRFGISHFRVLVNRAGDEAAAQRAFGNLAQAARGFLDARIEYAGVIPIDPTFTLAAGRFVPIVESHPTAPAAKSFQRIARAILEWPARRQGAATPDSLFHRVIHTSRARIAGAGA